MISLLEAAAANDVERIRRAVLEERQDPNAQHPRAGTIPLQIACETDSLGAVHELLALGADPNLSFSRNDRVMNRILRNHFPLLYAASQEVATALIRSGADVNRQTEDGDTALSWAILKMLPEVVEILLANGARKDVEVPWHGERLAIPIFVRRYREYFEGHTEPEQQAQVSAAIARIDSIGRIIA